MKGPTMGLTTRKPPLDPISVYKAWKQLPGARDKGLTIVEALRLVKAYPEHCGPLIEILGKCEPLHRARSLENALNRCIEIDPDLDNPRLEVSFRALTKVRKCKRLPLGTEKRPQRFTTPDKPLCRNRYNLHKVYRVTR